MNKYFFLMLVMVTSLSTSSLAQSQVVIEVEGQENNCFMPFEDKARLALLDLNSNAQKVCTSGFPEQASVTVLHQLSSCLVVAKARFTCREY